MLSAKIHDGSLPAIANHAQTGHVMFIPLLYMIPATLLFTAGFLSSSLIVTVLCIWSGAALAIVAGGYWLNRHEIFRKNADGRIPSSIRVLLWPFMLGVSLYNHWRRQRDNGPAYHQLAEHLYVGSRLFESDVDELRQQGIVAILDVTAEFNGLDWRQQDDSLHYLNIPVLDHRFPALEQLHQALNWLHNHIRQKRSVIVHCALGRGRSVFTCAAYLAASQNDKSLNQILADINAIRAIAKLNPSQKKQLHGLDQARQLHFGDNAALIINPVAGGKKWQQHKHLIMQQLSQSYQLSVYKTTPEQDATELSKQALQHQPQIMIAGGGDGTVNEVAAALLHTDTPMGILPLGTANAFYMALVGEHAALLPIDIACDVIQRRHVSRIDTICCNERLALLMVGLGFQSDMIRGADRDAKDDAGQWAYLRSFWQSLNEGKALPLHYQLDDDEAFEQSTASVVIANAAPLSSLLSRGAGRPQFDDGKLAVTLIPEHPSLAGHLASLVELLIENLSPLDNGKYKQSYTPEKMTIKAPASMTAPLHYVIDGEPFTADSLNIHNQPASLSVLVP